MTAASDAALKAAEIAEVRRGSAFVEPSDVLDEMSDDVSAVLNRVVAGARAGEPAREVEGRKAGYGNHLVAAPGEGSEGRDEDRDDARVVWRNVGKRAPVVR